MSPRARQYAAQRRLRRAWVTEVCRKNAIANDLRDFWIATSASPTVVLRHVQAIVYYRAIQSTKAKEIVA